MYLVLENMLWTPTDRCTLTDTRSFVRSLAHACMGGWEPSQPHLDGDHVAFGRVTAESMKVGGGVVLVRV